MIFFFFIAVNSFDTVKQLKGTLAVKGLTMSQSLSRYQEDFDEIGLLAGGAFGKVYKARHKIDGVEYAVKQINMKNNDPLYVEQCLAEVRMLAKYNHPNIVSYKSAWIEERDGYCVSDLNKFEEKNEKNDSAYGDEEGSSCLVSFRNDNRSENLENSEINYSSNTNDQSSSNRNEPMVIIFIFLFLFLFILAID